MKNYQKHSIKHYKRPVVLSSRVRYIVYYKLDGKCSYNTYDKLLDAENRLQKVLQSIDNGAFIVRSTTDILKY